MRAIEPPPADLVRDGRTSRPDPADVLPETGRATYESRRRGVNPGHAGLGRGFLSFMTVSTRSGAVRQAGGQGWPWPGAHRAPGLRYASPPAHPAPPRAPPPA